MENRKRTIREIMNLVTRLREAGAVTIKIEDVEAIFLPKDINQSIPIVNTIQDILHTQEVAPSKVEKEEVQNLEEDDPDLFLSAKNE